MNQIFELYDEICGDTKSFHKTIEGAMKAMSELVAKLAKPLERDYEGDKNVDFKISYRIISHELKE